MCCLKYEQDAYEDLIRSSPKLESFVDTPDGRGTVVELDLLRQRVKVRMEDRPETVSVFANTDIYVLRNGKAKKTDAPIPADLAPISGKGKRAERIREEQDAPILETIRFRYSTEAIVEEPAPEPVVAEEEAPAPAKSRNRRNRRNRGQKNGEKPQAEKAEKPQAPAPKKEEPSQGEEKAAKKPRRHNHHRRRKPRSDSAKSE
jgi:hypothetical protein